MLRHKSSEGFFIFQIRPTFRRISQFCLKNSKMLTLFRIKWSCKKNLLTQNMVQPVYYSPVHVHSKTDEIHVLFSNFRTRNFPNLYLILFSCYSLLWDTPVMRVAPPLRLYFLSTLKDVFAIHSLTKASVNLLITKKCSVHVYLPAEAQVLEWIVPGNMNFF